MMQQPSGHLCIKAMFLAITIPLLSGCSTTELAVSGTAATIYAGRSPASEIEQTYYLGIFDPQEQLPPEVYRVRIHGQASMLSQTKFASGWVPAEVVDSLGSQIGFSPRTTASGESNGLGGLEINKSKEFMSSLSSGRRQILFGPEGFLEAPRNHRLVVLMGTSPDKFFRAVDETLGSLSGADDAARQNQLRKKVMEALFLLGQERLKLQELPDSKSD